MRQRLHLGEALCVLERGAGERGDELRHPLLLGTEQVTDLTVNGVPARHRPTSHEDRRRQRRARLLEHHAVGRLGVTFRVDRHCPGADGLDNEPFRQCAPG